MNSTRHIRLIHVGNINQGRKVTLQIKLDVTAIGDLHKS